jgi:hypothetical protein
MYHEKKRNAYRILVGNSEEKTSVRKFNVGGKIILKKDLSEIGWGRIYWDNLA